MSVEKRLGSIEGPELLGPRNESRQLRNVEDELIEKLDEGVAEPWEIDLGNEVLQVLAFPFVKKNCEAGRAERAGGGECWKFGSGRDWGYWNSMEREVGLGKVDKQVANVCQ